MPKLPPQKFKNSHLWERAAKHGGGHFLATARFANPDYIPSYMQLEGEFTPGWHQVQLATHALQQAAEDTKLLSLELREYHSA